jgi:hypothetical protein
MRRVHRSEGYDPFHLAAEAKAPVRLSLSPLPVHTIHVLREYWAKGVAAAHEREVEEPADA